MSRTRIEDLTPAAQRGWGAALMALGALTAWIVNRHPENLRAPAWVAYAACATFGIAGLAIALRSWLTRRAYAWAMVVLLCVMTTIPAWVAVGSGARQCRSTLPLLRGERACRIGFGISGVLMLGVCAISVQMARRTPPDDPSA